MDFHFSVDLELEIKSIKVLSGIETVIFSCGNTRHMTNIKIAKCLHQCSKNKLTLIIKLERQIISMGFPGGTPAKYQEVNNLPANEGDMRLGFDSWIRKIP